MKCNNCNSTRVSEPRLVIFEERDSDYTEEKVICKCFDCGYVGEAEEFQSGPGQS